MTRRHSILALAMVLFAAACGGGSDDGTGGVGGGGAGAGGSGGGGLGNLPAEPEPPSLESADARVVGRRGRDLLVGVDGSDPNGDVVLLRLRLLDASGADIPVADLDGDASPDSSLVPVRFADPILGDASFVASATLPGIYLRAPTLVSVGARLVDRHGLESEERVLAIETQPIRSAGETCDPAAVADRCQDGLGCRGEDPTCQEGLAPSIDRLGYVKTTGSPRILIEGTESEDDLAVLRLDFLDSRGEAVSVDFDGDDVLDASFLEIEAGGFSSGGTFFLTIEPMPGFDVLVPQLSAVASDGSGHTGMAQQAKAKVASRRTLGQTCEPRGFDVCGSGLVCSPGLVGTVNKCDAQTRVLDGKLDLAPTLDPARGHTLFVGRAEGSSVLDAPAGCAIGDPTGRPEGIARLHLATGASRLTLATASPWTDFDTVVYLLPEKATASTSALGCGDDGATGSASWVEFANVPAGDYLIVVDSWGPAGGSFELSVAVE